MALNQRRLEILNLIQEDGHAKVQKLSKIFKVSEVTIRQDLEELENLGYIQREYGGAFLKDVGSLVKSGQVFNQTHMEEKRAIARKAAEIVKEGDNIILDSGSTTTELAKLLVGFKNLNVITNAINIAFILGENPQMYISLRRLEFDVKCEQDTKGEKFHVLTLVDGDHIRIRSAEHPERYFDLDFMEIACVPASMGKYVIENLGKEPIRVHKTCLRDGYENDPA